MSKKKSSHASHESGDQQLVRELFEGGVRAAKSGKEGSNPAARYDLSGAPLKRRKAAALSMLPRILEKYGHYYEDVDDTKHDFLVHCVASGNTVADADRNFYTTLAAAIWMLDELQDLHTLERAYPYFSRDMMSIESEMLPDILFDPCHDELVIKAMMELIRDRDGLTDEPNCYINSVTARRRKPEEHVLVDKDPEAMTPRERFNAVMSMIPSQREEQAVQRFEEKIWEFLDLLFSITSQYANEQVKLGKKLDESTGFLDALMDEEPMGNKKDKKIPEAMKQSPALPDLSLRSSKNIAGSERNEVLHSMTKIKRLIETYNGERYKRTGILLSAHTMQADICPMDSDILDQDMMDAVQVFEVDDPYETCFAYLCLLESGSDLPWLYNTALAVVLAACRKLPWHISKYEDDYVGSLLAEEEDDDEYEDELTEDGGEGPAGSDGDGEDGTGPAPDREEEHEGGSGDEGEDENSGDEDEYEEEGMDEDEIRKRADALHKSITELYRLRYSPNSLYTLPSTDIKINLPQVLFAETGILMPRRSGLFDGTAGKLSENGMEPGLAEGVELYCQLAEDTQRTSRDWDLFLRSSAFKRISEKQWEEYQSPKPENTEEEGPEELRQKLREEQARSAELRKALHESTKEAEQLKNAAEAFESAAEADREELALLREIIYEQANSQEFPDEPEEGDTIVFPYSARRRSVVFGGHDAWLKKIQPMLPNVVFIKDQNPNADMIRRADVIWLQPNALSHRLYYKIIDIVRTNHIPIYYFADSSAKKCALQFVESELEDMEEK